MRDRFGLVDFGRVFILHVKFRFEFMLMSCERLAVLLLSRNVHRINSMFLFVSERFNS